MLNKNDEYLHEFKNSNEWTESFNLNIFDKKSNIFGYADVDYFFGKNKVEFNWVLFIDNKRYTYNKTIDFDGKLQTKKITDQKFAYKIIKPLEIFELALKNDIINASIKMDGIFPIYIFPTSFNEDTVNTNLENEISLWNRYEQRCKISGIVTVKDGKGKNTKKQFECFGQRRHIWGNSLLSKMNCLSTVTIQFKNMAMGFSYIEMDGSTISNGFISKKSGNIPLQNVDFELISFNKNSNDSASSEFSYTDAQDDKDLIVSKKLFSISLPPPQSKTKSFIKFRNFSEFTIIGSNKKGIGMEDHLISVDRIKSLY